MNWTISFTKEDITVSLDSLIQRGRGIGRLFSSAKTNLAANLLISDEPGLVMAIGEMKGIAEELGLSLDIGSNAVTMPHAVAASLTSEAAEQLGLPPLLDLTLQTNVKGLVGSSDFALTYAWFDKGVRQFIDRTGCLLETSTGLRRLPLWIMRALDIADGPSGDNEDNHWEKLARYRQALAPAVSVNAGGSTPVALSHFLRGLQIRLTDCFSIGAVRHRDDTDFDIIPFSREKLHPLEEGGVAISEKDSDLLPDELENFQRRVRVKGSLPSYKVGNNQYLVVDSRAQPVLSLMVQKQNADPAEREAFIKNPWPDITKVIEANLEKKGLLDNLTDEQRAEELERYLEPVFVETSEYSARVLGLARYESPRAASWADTVESLDWLPEIIPNNARQRLAALPPERLPVLAEMLEVAIQAGKSVLVFDDEQYPASNMLLNAVTGLIGHNESVNGADKDILVESEDERQPKDEPGVNESRAPFALQSRENFEALNWKPSVRPRNSAFISGSGAGTLPHVPLGITTPLKPHQEEGFRIMVSSWMAGMPGILNADEQGLGKTLETLAFLRWLKDNYGSSNERALPSDPDKVIQPGPFSRVGPILVVAPTSLLENWSNEVAQHSDSTGLGQLLRLYGNNLAQYKKQDASETETQSGTEQLNLERLQMAITKGKGSRFWLLTTYTTLRNYHLSFARIGFSVVVFDEIQALKNPASLTSVAARALNADYRIGLTGTPIENSLEDLWAITDQLTPGYMGTLKEFSGRYAEPERKLMQDLHCQVFQAQKHPAPLGFRRMKEDVAADLPVKLRYLYPRIMPTQQASVYDSIRDKLNRSSPGAALKILHHIRGVSVHPAFDVGANYEDFIGASARLTACFGILEKIEQKQECVLVFIENRKMQYQFIELVKRTFNLSRIDLINGSTPIAERAAIVERFQTNLKGPKQFALLVLSPKAAGAGLTLTAATHIIHLSRWWNPAVEEQCNDRAHRIGQSRPVCIHIPMAVHSSYLEQSFDCLLHVLMTRKRQLAQSTLWPTGSNNDMVTGLRAGLFTSSAVGVRGHQQDTINAVMQSLSEKTNEILRLDDQEGRYRIEG